MACPPENHFAAFPGHPVRYDDVAFKIDVFVWYPERDEWRNPLTRFVDTLPVTPYSASQSGLPEYVQAGLARRRNAQAALASQARTRQVYNNTGVAASLHRQARPQQEPFLATPGPSTQGRRANTWNVPTQTHGYQGCVKNNESVDILQTENCAVFLRNLPFNCDIPLLLGSLRNIGKIYASNIVPPSDRFDTAGAKIVFFDRSAVDNLFEQIKSKRLTVGERFPEVVHNRHRAAAQPVSNKSRVVIIMGPPEIVNPAHLRHFFAGANFWYDIDQITTCWEEPGQRVMEWHFSSFRCQASNAMRAIYEKKGSSFRNKQEQELWAKVTATWGIDPCA
ncbi:hypothetical protein F5B20DRAFT_580905 [Whalleya microplaca]|nr:hypothetical protein F5B20DRAFT_580905 [Whalleya microplaca]